MKTSRQIQSDIFRLLKGSSLSKLVSGGIYHAGTRPRDSKKEDIVIRFTAGISEQIERGVVTILIYVPDVTPFADGVFVEDVKRCEWLETRACEWLESLADARSGYLFTLDRTIETLASRDATQREHFISIRMKYNYYEGN